jgi:hypothetical protein
LAGFAAVIGTLWPVPDRLGDIPDMIPATGRNGPDRERGTGVSFHIAVFLIP